MSRIKHPNPRPGTFTDRLGDVVFHDGYAEVDLTHDENLADAYRMHGYEIEESVELAADLDGTGRNLPPYVEGDGEKTAPALDYLDNWTKAKLIAYAGEQGFDLGGAQTKAEILEAIGAHAPDAFVTEV
ncbi:hypothetical protein [Cryobacterium aureum]|uniref:hypothetical protein n=1 Tax=Cryobacterium aureum TaxID=995037 RepID=UPI000CF3D2E4|nr:hypothetical protein [Cryobacterium aureum]